MKDVEGLYTTEVDTVADGAWDDAVSVFLDANIYQTSAYGNVRFGRQNTSRLLVKRRGEVVAAAQARIVRVPILNAGIAYVRWGPLWRPRGRADDPEAFRQGLKALRREYAERRGYVLRIYPALFDDAADTFVPLLREEGFALLEGGKKDRTILIDLKAPVAELRKGLAQKWRNSLNKSERSNLELVEGDDDGLFGQFIDIYGDMLQRKQFVEPNDIDEFRRMQQALPAALKMKIVLCRQEGLNCSGGIFSAMGDAGLYLFGATNEAGMHSNGSYLIQWKYLEWLKEKNLARYDLNGINPETNPGTYKFKEGLCGKNGRDVHFLGQWELCERPLSRLVVRCGEAWAGRKKTRGSRKSA
jgi:lipid II:glycine glycyltransferase (peptidoglycan interpeptide bridge formation enzyme)